MAGPASTFFAVRVPPIQNVRHSHLSDWQSAPSPARRGGAGSERRDARFLGKSDQAGLVVAAPDDQPIDDRLCPALNLAGVAHRTTLAQHLNDLVAEL